MKAVIIGIIIAIIVLVIGVAAAGYYFGIWGGRAAISSPSPVPTAPPSPSLPVPTMPPVTSPAPTATVPGTSAVKFEMAVTEVSGTGFTRTVTAKVTNTGNVDAHNAWGKVEVFSQGQRIKLSGQDSARVDVGTIKAGVTATAQVTLSFGLADGLKIQQNGADVQFTINSDEGTQTLTYQYQP